jgi:hypothetical protein
LPNGKANGIYLSEGSITKIENVHGKDIKSRGFPNAKSFVKHFIDNFDAIYKASGLEQFAMAVRVPEQESWGVVELRIVSEAEGYRIVTAHPVRLRHFKNKIPLWERAPVVRVNDAAPQLGDANWVQSGTASLAQSEENNNTPPRENVPDSRSTGEPLIGTEVGQNGKASLAQSGENNNTPPQERAQDVRDNGATPLLGHANRGQSGTSNNTQSEGNVNKNRVAHILPSLVNRGSIVEIYRLKDALSDVDPKEIDRILKDIQLKT